MGFVDIDLHMLCSSSEVVDVSKVKPTVSALSSYAINSGLRDVLDDLNQQRFIVSPRELKFPEPAVQNSFLTPEFVGQNGKCFVYSIPLNTIAVERLNLENSSQHIYTKDLTQEIQMFGINPIACWALDLGSQQLVLTYLPHDD